MARGDLLVRLVKASAEGNQSQVRATTSALIAEERAKNHHVLADRLTRAMANGTSPSTRTFPASAHSPWREYAFEMAPNRRLEDLSLREGTLQACRELIEEQHRASILRAHSVEPRHRILLIGPPGNGKTSLAEAVAESLAVPFIVIRYETLIGSYLGETASRLRRVIDYVRTIQCVLFFDEFDAIAKERGDTHETGEIKRVVTSLLLQVDRLPSYVVTMAATNHPELLDRAVWRRFQLRLRLDAPTPAELTRYFQEFATSVGQPLGHSAKGIAARLGPISYAEAEEFCLDVRRRTVLAMGQSSLRMVVSEVLKVWDERRRVNSK